jgi:hypothetical protein
VVPKLFCRTLNEKKSPSFQTPNLNARWFTQPLRASRNNKTAAFPPPFNHHHEAIAINCKIILALSLRLRAFAVLKLFCRIFNFNRRKLP